MPVKKAPPGLKSWTKGQSGNPGGRPKIPEHVREMAKALTVEAIGTLAEIMRDKESPATARLAASEALLNRAWGKVETTTNVKVSRDVRELSTAEILAALASVGAIGEEEVGGEPDQLH